MARSKSPTGGRAPRRTNETANEEQMAAVPASAPETSHLNPGTPQLADPQTRTERLAETHLSPEPRKLGMPKSEPRKSVVVPINVEDEIRRRAYEIYQHRGTAPGSEAEDWFAAEREVRERYKTKQQSA